MKNNILMYLLGVCTFILLSFTSAVNLTTIKPAKPVSTIVLKDVRDSNRYSKHLRNGYQVHSISSSETYSYTIVLVKY